MAFEQWELLGISDQLLQNVFGLVRNMRDNAQGYKAQVTAGQPLAGIASVMVQDADRYLARLQWITDLATRNLTKFDDALALKGLTRTGADGATALRDALIAVANHTKGALLTTGAQINAEADFILANVPNFDRLT